MYMYEIVTCLNVWRASCQCFGGSHKYLSPVMRKPPFCKCENKDADQLRSNCAADQRLCFRYTDSTIPLLPKSEISSLYLSSVAVQPGLCRTWSETPKTGFLRTRLIWHLISSRQLRLQPSYHHIFFQITLRKHVHVLNTIFFHGCKKKRFSDENV